MQAEGPQQTGAMILLSALSILRTGHATACRNPATYQAWKGNLEQKPGYNLLPLTRAPGAKTGQCLGSSQVSLPTKESTHVYTRIYWLLSHTQTGLPSSQSLL